MPSKIFIGCSGFHYKEWKNVFYPEALAQSKWFSFYCEHFNTIELNTTFYRFPKPEALRSWYLKSPENFRFSVKGPRLISHYKMFIDCENLLGDFYASVYEGLTDKLGCILFQLPSRVVYSDETLNRIIENLNPTFSNVVEFRDKSWWNKKVYNTLKKHKISFCGISHPTLQDNIVNNNSILYYRFHGVPVLYKSAYSEEFLEEKAVEINNSKIKEAWIYFNNTWGTAAIGNSKYLQKLFKETG